MTNFPEPADSLESQLEPVAARLLDAQVAFAMQQLRGEKYHSLVLDEVEHALAEASEITLAEAVTPAMIKNVAAKYAVQVPVEGGIAELVSDVASRLYELTATTDTSFGDVIDGRRFGELSAMVVETGVAQRMLERILSSEAFTEFCVTLVQHSLAESVTQGGKSLARGRLGRMFGGLGARMPQGPVERLELRAEGLAARGARFLLAHTHADEDVLVEAVNQLWRSNLDNPLSSAVSVISAADVEDAIVPVYEFWRTFRDTDYFRSLLDEGIDQVFEKYGDVSLYDLLLDLGVGREDMIEEALRFGPPVIALLDERGYLESVLRRRLIPFYISDQFREALAGR
ncbi:hypothetical protein FZI85_24935 [Mycobacterium sp. CBMA293]|uniref:hypothetical protein n=1 Tax=unclassified Mycolicibacterium TaxID=2636767 RepID=UPI0012DC0BFB|nr:MULTISPECIES: hypothetical protein [unclassified Mycolicibacterium]MUL50029.1 hypothetical protein [Mycolicibacterium sp. CBMA 360]MUL61915.1 hypothetical protein [Mycolicibacterium sp. CBMA 335]MUL72600.1 hypothetical protein [Mycolicibacterium sp. CBMA 311]MUL92795.1 hypothetical protein [Mycolicibacterium sp. CBMA 230]MUM08763.1 hypothetical protein [Mycolicibacterium sp. CBMA 213]